MRQTNKKRRLFEDDEILGSTDVLGLSKVPKDAAKAAIGGGTIDAGSCVGACCCLINLNISFILCCGCCCG